MKKSLAILTVVGMASAAVAQDNGWRFEFDRTELNPANPTVMVTLLATFPASDHAFAGARASVRASESGWVGVEKLLPGSSGPGTSAGTIAGADVTGLILGQVHFPPTIIADPTNPQPVWRGEFTVTDFTARSVDFSTATTDFRIYPDIATATSSARTATEARGSVSVIPAPASLALLGLGGLAAARRRR